MANSISLSLITSIPDENAALEKSDFKLIPDEALLKIFDMLQKIDLICISKTCRKFQRVAEDCHLTRNLQFARYLFNLHSKFKEGNFGYHLSEIKIDEEESFISCYGAIHPNPSNLLDIDLTQEQVNRY